MNDICPECGAIIYPFDSGCWYCTGQELNVPPEIIEKAKKIIEEKKGDWPEDDWYTLDADWDLNLFNTGYLGDGESEENIAVICLVIDGMIKTNRSKIIDIE